MSLDWSAPGLAPWREPGERLARRIAAGAPVHAALNEEAGRARVSGVPRFVPQQALGAGMPYERFIRESGCCPSRDNLHDFLNGLVWLAFPRAKARLNELQADQIARHGIGAERGPVRDAVTLFDENGLLLQAPPPLWEALLAREWRRLFVELRPLWTAAQVLIFGHALLEKLAAPRKDMTAHVWRAPAPLHDAAQADRWLAGEFTPDALAAKPFTPLPVLGIPGWCAANQNFSFYDDSLVFRPMRRRA
ncbi:DUF3025 domain-containing protein [Ramlibacter rhizophilus]|uniref:DUF3025 domain-containing protein n=1 Tax=Ramlibacter rhizophilus TaxID=1781167 RepID=A0A4Z0BP31_9BURK|nr:DUF3025 domain-containing protein [Ramlibacter rhizophilus]